MNVTKLENGYTFVMVAGKGIAIESLKSGDVIRQSLSGNLFVIMRKEKFDGYVTRIVFRRFNADNFDAESDETMYLQNEEIVWHVGEVF